MFELQYGMGVLRSSGQSCPRSSVALPLGINGGACRTRNCQPCGSDAREVPQFSTRERRVAGLPWGGVRPARLFESQKFSPKHRPVSASLRLCCRSATFAVARWDFLSVLLVAKREKSLFTRAGDGFFARTKRRRASSFNCPRAGQAPRPVDGRNLRFAKAAFTPILCPRASRAARLKLQKHA